MVRFNPANIRNVPWGQSAKLRSEHRLRVSMRVKHSLCRVERIAQNNYVEVGSDVERLVSQVPMHEFSAFENQRARTSVAQSRDDHA